MGQVTFSPVVVARLQRANGSNNIKVRVTYRRAYRLVSTTLYAMPADLDRKGHIKNNNLKYQVGKVINDMEQALGKIPYYELETMDVAQVVRRISDILGERSFRLDFFDFGREFLSRRAPGTASVYRFALANLAEFLGREKLDVNDITGDMLREYGDWLERRERGRGRPCKDGYIQREMQHLNAVFNAACRKYNDEENDIRRIRRRPFANIDLKSMPSHGQTSLKPEVIQRLIDYDPPKPTQRMALRLFLASFAMMGMNMSDLYTCEAPRDGVLTYCRNKTRARRADNARMVVRVPDCVSRLLEPYISRTGPKWLDLKYRNIASLNSTVDAALRSVARQLDLEPFSFYAARHSFATIGRSRLCGIDKATIDECLCHVGDYRIADIYIERDWEVLWDARDKVMGLFRWR